MALSTEQEVLDSGYSPAVLAYLQPRGQVALPAERTSTPLASEPEPALNNGYTPTAGSPFPTPLYPNTATSTANNLGNLYTTNASGAYNAFPTTPAAPRTTVVPAEFTQGGGMVDTMQKAGVNPALYGALSFGAYAQPEFANVGVTGNLGSTSVADATNSYLTRLKNTEQEQQAASVQNQQQWNNMFMNSPTYNPNGANTYAIQNNPVSTGTPLFTGTNNTSGNTITDGSGVRVNTPTSLANGTTNNTNTTTTNNGGLRTNTPFAGNLTASGNPVYTQPINTSNNLGGLYEAGQNRDTSFVGKVRGDINYARALWR